MTKNMSRYCRPCGKIVEHFVSYKSYKHTVIPAVSDKYFCLDKIMTLCYMYILNIVYVLLICTFYLIMGELFVVCVLTFYSISWPFAKYSGHLSGCIVSRLSRFFPDSWPNLTALYQNIIYRGLQVSAVPEEIAHSYHETTNPVHQSTLPTWCTLVHKLPP